MKVSIIGPGALGCVFATYIARAGVNVVLVDYREDRARRLSQYGIAIEDRNGIQTFAMPVQTVVPEDASFAIVLVKSYATKYLRFPKPIPVLTLQNGLGNVEVLARQVGEDFVLAGVTSEASTLLSEGHTRHVAAGITRLASWTGSSKNITYVADCLSRAGFNIRIESDARRLLWSKLVASAAINPLTALYNVTNGELLRHSGLRDQFTALAREAVDVAEAEGVVFDEDPVEEAMAICEHTSANISSMLQDIRMRRSTEIESIAGEIVRRGESFGLSVEHTRRMLLKIRDLQQNGR